MRDTKKTNFSKNNLLVDRLLKLVEVLRRDR